MTDETKNDSCCTPNKGSCCCGFKAFIGGILVGLVLTSAAFGIAIGAKCAAASCSIMGGSSAKMCPITHSQTQTK